jgi:hypothetical protein
VYRFLTDERFILPGAEQRQIARIYLTAFLDATLRDEVAYRALFEDPRNGAGWLPDNFMLANYADTRTHWLAKYEEDADPTTGTDPDAAIEGHDLTVWREDDVDLKLSALGTHVVILGWDDRVHPQSDANYRIRFRNPVSVSPLSAVVFSASQIEVDTLPTQFKAPGPRRNADREPLDWSMVLADAAGHEARLPLSFDQVLYPQVKGVTHRAAILGGATSEVIMRRYRFALSAFLAVKPDLDLGHLAEIRFSFDRSTRGAIALDDLGLVETDR